MRSTAAVPLMLLVLASLAACDLLTPRETLIPDAVGVVETIDDPGGMERPITFTLTTGESVERTRAELIAGTPQPGDLMLAGHEPRVWAWGLVPNTLSPNLPAGCFLTGGSNRKQTVDGQEVIDLLPTGTFINNEPETWIRLPVDADFRGFVNSQGEVGGGQMCLNDRGEVFWAVGG